MLQRSFPRPTNSLKKSPFFLSSNGLWCSSAAHEVVSRKKRKVLRFASFRCRFVSKDQCKCNHYLIILISSLKVKTKGGFLPSIKCSLKSHK